MNNVKKSQKALKHLKKIRKLMSKVKNPYEGMSQQEIIDEMRKTREKLWEEKIASCSRY